MVKCENWEEFEWFLDTYCNFSCLNCTYGGKHGESSQFLFCMRTISMVNFNFMFVCAEWKSDKGKTLEDYVDCKIWKLPDSIIDKLNSGEMTIKDIREYGVNYEQVIEEESNKENS